VTLSAQQCMVFTQVASEGGLLPRPIVRDKFEIWPAKRREVIVDFSKYMDGTPTTKGDVMYLVNTAKMVNGRKMNKSPLTTDDQGNVAADPEFDPSYAVPLLKIVIGDSAPDNSADPLDYVHKVNGKAVLKTGALKLRPMPKLPSNLAGLTTRTFELQRSGTYGGEIEWLINGHAFDRSDPNGMFPQAVTLQGRPEIWVIRNGGGGWSHPMHMHMEEHQVLSRNGVATGSPNADPRHADDIGKEDVVNLDPSEEVIIYRNFRTFKGRYVAHCHNLAHEDHAMMFGWEIS
jgi:FtsP/CotA-like multicopper oxidase with cupredoxin domain